MANRLWAVLLLCHREGGVSFFREALLKNSSLLFVFIKCSQSVKGVLLVC